MHKQYRRTSVKQAKFIVNTRSCSIPIHVVSLGEVVAGFCAEFFVYLSDSKILSDKKV